MTKMISLEEARELVLSRVTTLEAETVDLLDAAGRVAAAEVGHDASHERAEPAEVAPGRCEVLASGADQCRGRSEHGREGVSLVAGDLEHGIRR